MIAKLWKHEWLDNRRTLLGVAGASALVSLLASAGVALGLPDYGFSFVAGAVAVALPAVVTVLLLWSYWKTMYGRLGYFTGTIPVRGRVVFAAKLTFTLAACVLAALEGVALFLVLMIAREREWTTPAALMADFWKLLTGAPHVGLWVLALVVVELACMLVQLVAGISIGQGPHLVRQGVAGSVIVLIALYLVNQLTNLASMVLIPASLRIGGPEAGHVVWSPMLGGLFNGSFHSGASADLLGLGFIPVTIVLTAVVAWLGVRSIERHTSLR